MFDKIKNFLMNDIIGEDWVKTSVDLMNGVTTCTYEYNSGYTSERLSELEAEYCD